MSPYREAGRGTFVLDMRLGKLGRCKRASGTDDLDVFRDVLTTLRRLRKERRWELLTLVVTGRVKPIDLCEAVWNSALGELPTADEAWLLEPLVEDWLSGLDKAERTVTDYRRMLLALAKNRATVATLPRQLEARRRAAIKSGHRKAFNNLLSPVRMMLRKQLGPDHPVTKAVWRIEWLEILNRRPGNPQTTDQVRALAAKLGKHSPTLWALCLTGMRKSEYFGRRWTVQGDRLAVAGVKAGRKRPPREIPLIYPVSVPTCGYRWFKRQLHDASGGTVTVHDCRYTWMRWLEEGGVPGLRIRYYAGHSVRDVTELYRRGRGFTEHLVQDAERVRTWLGDAPPPVLRAVEA